MQNSRCLKNRTQHLVVLVMFFVFNMWGNRTTARVKAAAADHDEGRPQRSTARHSSLRSRQTCKTSAAGLNWTLTTKCFHVLTEPARWTVNIYRRVSHTHTHIHTSRWSTLNSHNAMHTGNSEAADAHVIPPHLW